MGDRLGLAHQLAEAGELDKASELCSQLANENPHDPKILSVAAYIYMQAERFGFAYALLEKASKAMPRTELLNNLGMCALGCMRLDDAERHLRDALKLDRNNSAAMNNLALVYVNKCEPDKAIEWANKCRSIVGDRDDVMETYGYANLMLRNWAEGWRGYEGGLNGKIRRPRQYQQEQYWDGSPVKTLVIRGEQGIGDEISFASVFDDAKARAENVVIECDSRLEALFRRSFDAPVYGTRFKQAVPWAGRYKIEAHALSGSLCKYFRNEDSSFPGKPYLKADPEQKIQWRALLDSLGNKPKIGIAWTGGRHNTHRERRSLELMDFLPILKHDATFISLEYKNPAAEILELYNAHGIEVRHWPRASEAVNYDDCAALVDELDLVISVQTAVVHLAGALGKPCWVLVPSKPHWRYGLNGDSLPWYSSVRLYRQKGPWSHVMQRISEDYGAWRLDHGHRAGA